MEASSECQQILSVHIFDICRSLVLIVAMQSTALQRQFPALLLLLVKRSESQDKKSILSYGYSTTFIFLLSIYDILIPHYYFILQEGIGISEILNAIVQRVPPPNDTVERPLRALIFDRQLFQVLHFFFCVLCFCLRSDTSRLFLVFGLLDLNKQDIHLDKFFFLQVVVK